MKISFLFICEGSSDAALIPHLEALCVTHGADEAMGIYPDFGRIQLAGKTISEKVAAALKLEPTVNLLFIHRDADSTDPDPRYEEIATQMKKVDTEVRYVAVVPVQETEAWLILDDDEIKNVAENPKCNITLSLPKANRVEKTANPKEILKATIAKASETSGKRLKKINKSFPSKRRQLIERLDITGDVRKLPSWQRLEHDISATLSALDADPLS